MGNMSFKKILASVLSAPSVGDRPPTVEAARALMNRYTPSSLLPYRGWDDEFGGCLLNEGNSIAFGFGYELNPMIAAGRTTEDQLESVINICRPGTSIMFAMLSNDDIHHQIRAWLKTRLQNEDQHPMLKEMAIQRAKFMMDCVTGSPLVKDTQLFARNVRCFAFFRVPFDGKIEEPAKVYEWLNRIRDLNSQLSGAMGSIGIHPKALGKGETKRLIMQLMNPHYSPEELDRQMSGTGYENSFSNFVMRGTRMTVNEKDGSISFTGGKEDRDRIATVITVDQYPEELGIQDTRNLMGAPFNREDCIPDAFWMWTAIEVLDPDRAKSEMLVRLGAMNKQALSESAWIRSMQGPLMKRKDQTETFMDICSKGHPPCRMMTGIVVFSPKDRAASAGESVTSLWRKAGFQASVETNIGLPLFNAAMPWGYSAMFDSGNKGLQRMEMVHTFNAACAIPVAADWRGHSIASGGPTLFSRRGQIASINLLQSETNYNITVVADSGAGKSFTMAEFITTYLSMEGMVRVIDAGASYARLAELIGGENLVFSPSDRKSMNPFWGIKTVDQLNEEMPTLKELVIMMAYPAESETSWASAQMEEGVKGAWQTAGASMGTDEIYEWFLAQSRVVSTEDGPRAFRYKDIADQLKPYTRQGRYGTWFNGEPQIHLSNAFTILELDELNRDPQFRTVIMSLVLNLIVRDLYGANNRKTKEGGIIPKLVLIDEAWDLMGKESGRAGKFIEQAARRIRKYNGTLGTITQSYGDYKLSAAAEAAFVNAAWRLSLKQSGPSVAAAKQMGLFPPDDEYMWKMLSSINRGRGYSEVHIHNKIGDIFRFIVDPFSYWVFTTSPEDKSALARAKDRGLNTIDAIKYCADMMQQGKKP